MWELCLASDNPVCVPHVSRGFGVLEFCWLTVQLVLWARRSNPTRQKRSVYNQRSFNRVVFGVYCGLVGTWMLLDAKSFQSFFGLSSNQTLFV